MKIFLTFGLPIFLGIFVSNLWTEFCFKRLDLQQMLIKSVLSHDELWTEFDANVLNFLVPSLSQFVNPFKRAKRVTVALETNFTKRTQRLIKSRKCPNVFT